jgi:4-amino-4-deoxy-L-arabinose transferase-like glycosyltransferase
MMPKGAGGPNGQNGGAQFSQETGNPGILRFFTQPLSKQMSWLLPFALISLVLAGFSTKVKLPVESGVHKAFILWGGWLMTCVVFFSLVSGIFHAYYAIMLAAPLGAVVGLGFSYLWNMGKEKKLAGILLIAAAGITIAFQAFASYQYGEKWIWAIIAVILLAIGAVLMSTLKRTAFITLLAAMLFIPAYWTVMTTVSSSNNNLPTAYGGTSQGFGPGNFDRARQQDDGQINNNQPQPGGPQNEDANQELLAYLQANTQDTKYLVAVPSSHQGSSMVLETGRPVLLMGGFGGQDNVVSVDDLKQMVTNNELRYILYGAGGRGPNGSKQEILNWIQTSCTVVPEFSNISTGRAPQGPGSEGGTTLYLCK